MGALEAQDHLQMVDRILSRAEEPACLNGGPFIIWGVVGAAMDLAVQVVFLQKGPPSLFWLPAILVACAIVFMVFFAARMAKRGRRGVLDRHIGNVFVIAWIVALIVMLLGAHIFTEWAQGAVWSLMFGSAMLFCGLLTRSRISFTGGAAVILSIIAANFAYPYAGYILAAGFLIGMSGAGVALTLARGNG